MGGTWECRDVNVEFREKIGSRVLVRSFLDFGSTACTGHQGIR